MATASVTYSFSGGGNAAASQVNQDFSDVVTFLNNSVLHVDGSKQLTGQLSLLSGTDPTADDHAARKKYVDKRALSYARTNPSAVLGFTASTEVASVTITDPGYDISVGGDFQAFLTVVSPDATMLAGVSLYVDGVMKTTKQVSTTTTAQSLSIHLPQTTHSTGTNCVVKAYIQRIAGSGYYSTNAGSTLTWLEVGYAKA